MLKVNMTCKYRDNINICLHDNCYLNQTQEIEVRSTNKEPCKGDDGVTITLKWTCMCKSSLHISYRFSPTNITKLMFSGSGNAVYTAMAEHLCGDSNVTIFT